MGGITQGRRGMRECSAVPRAILVRRVGRTVPTAKRCNRRWGGLLIARSMHWLTVDGGRIQNTYLLFPQQLLLVSAEDVRHAHKALGNLEYGGFCLKKKCGSLNQLFSTQYTLTMSLFIGFGSQTGAAQDIANSIAARAEDELPEVDVEIEALNKFKVCGAAV